MNKIVIDTGVLVALFNGNDSFHNQAINFIQKIRCPLFTNLPAITEVTYLLDFKVNAQADFLKWISEGALELIDVTKNDLVRIRELMLKYKDLPMDFTDGALVVLCEKLETKFLATIDRDFEIYRYQNRQKFSNIFLKRKKYP